MIIEIIYLFKKFLSFRYSMSLLILVQLSLHISFEFRRWLVRCITTNRYSIPVDQKFGEIPFDCINQSSATLCFQPLIQWVGIIAVDIDFCKHIPFDIVLFDEFLDIDRTTRLLVKWIRGKSKYGQALIAIFGVQLIKFFIVCFGQPTFGGYIHNKHNFAFVFVQLDILIVDVFNSELVNSLCIPPRLILRLYWLLCMDGMLDK